MVVAAGFDINALKPFIKGIDINVKGTMLEMVFKFDFGSEEIAKTMAVAVGQQLREIMG